MVLQDVESQFGQLAPPERLLLGPGPSNCHPRVLAALATPLVGHLDPAFLAVMDDVQALLRYAFQTRNHLTLPVSGTGSAGMETCIVNLVEPGDRILVLVNGVFGSRMVDVASRAGAEVKILERPWGEAFDLDEIRKAVRDFSPKIVALVHAETSTGVEQPMAEIGDVVHAAGALLLVDCVTSLAGSPVHIDRWGVDAAYSGTQKCLSCPPGLSPITLSERAREVLRKRKTKVQSWYLDLTMVENYWGGERTYHHTAPISMNYALREALRIVSDEGLEARWRRHRQNHLALRAGLEAMGLEFAVREEWRLPQLNVVKIPEGVDDKKIRSRLLKEFGIEIGGGLGAFAGKVWRIGLMGESSREGNVYLFLAALEKVLAAAGAKISRSEAVAAAQRVFTP